MDLSVSIYAIYAIYEFLFPDIPLCDETPLALLGDDETLTKPWEVSDELPCSDGPFPAFSVSDSPVCADDTQPSPRRAGRVASGSGSIYLYTR